MGTTYPNLAEFNYAGSAQLLFNLESVLIASRGILATGHKSGRYFFLCWKILPCICLYSPGILPWSNL